jgi:hemoglobin/transferrin/lactoferrin receptor protein
MRTASGRRLSANLYEDFIELQALGFNPATGLIEFQHRNVSRARIRGVEATADSSLGRLWTARAAFAWSEGEDRVRRAPLNSIHPTQLAAGLRRTAAAGRWSVELAGRFTAAKDVDELDRSKVDQFATPSSAVLDLFGSYEISRRWSFDAGAVNLLDETYWEWPDALGQAEGSPVLDRYTGPGRSLVAALRFVR